MQSILDGHIEDILDLLKEGATFRSIAEVYGCSISTLHKFLNTDEHSVRTRAALEISASSYANKGEQVLLDAEKDKIEIQRARELAQHYRWMAGKRNPKKYGDASLLKLANPDGEELKVNAVFNYDPLQANDSAKEDSPS